MQQVHRKQLMQCDLLLPRIGDRPQQMIDTISAVYLSFITAQAESVTEVAAIIPEQA